MFEWLLSPCHLACSLRLCTAPFGHGVFIDALQVMDALSTSLRKHSYCMIYLLTKQRTCVNALR